MAEAVKTISSPVDITAIREQFPILQRKVNGFPLAYFDNAATSFPKPVAVAERVASVITEIGGSPGRATHRMSIDAARVLFDAREAVAAFIGALGAMLLVFGIVRTRNGELPTSMVLLAGVTVNFFFAAMVMFIASVLLRRL